MKKNSGFTLIEMSIVLVIIGLIIGGILVGRDLIKASEVNAQIAQITKYNSAVNTFKNKYGGIPGDLQANLAAQFGFVARAGTSGRGDGNGELDGYTSGTYAWAENDENLFFWEDLSAAGLIEGSFNSALDGTAYSCSSIAACSAYFPYAKIGGNNLIYVYSGYVYQSGPTSGFGPNFFGLSVLTSMTGGNVDAGSTPTAAGLTTLQAYNIDKKIDDGLPTTGSVRAQYLSNTAVDTGAPGWSANGTSPTATTCYDTSTGIAAYSIGYTGGSNINCAVSFKVQE